MGPGSRSASTCKIGGWEGEGTRKWIAYYRHQHLRTVCGLPYPGAQHFRCLSAFVYVLQRSLRTRLKTGKTSWPTLINPIMFPDPKGAFYWMIQVVVGEKGCSCFHDQTCHEQHLRSCSSFVTPVARCLMRRWTRLYCVTTITSISCNQGRFPFIL